METPHFFYDDADKLTSEIFECLHERHAQVLRANDKAWQLVEGGLTDDESGNRALGNLGRMMLEKIDMEDCYPHLFRDSPET